MKKGYTVTYNLLVSLKELYPKCEFYMCIGSDLLDGLENWDNGKQLIEEFKFIILARDTYEINPNKIKKGWILIKTEIFGSSTIIRNRISLTNNLSEKIYGLLSKSCIEYIRKEELYISK